MTKFHSFCKFHHEYVRKYGQFQRPGQALYNAMRAFDPEIESSIAGTKLDTFDNDKMIPGLWGLLYAEWIYLPEVTIEVTHA